MGIGYNIDEMIDMTDKNKIILDEVIFSMEVEGFKVPENEYAAILLLTIFWIVIPFTLFFIHNRFSLFFAVFTSFLYSRRNYI